MIFFKSLDFLEIYGTKKVQFFKSYTRCNLNSSFIYIYVCVCVCVCVCVTTQIQMLKLPKCQKRYIIKEQVIETI